MFWIPMLIAIVLVTLGRSVAIYPLCAVFARTRFAVDSGHQHVLFSGSLRGALALALTLSLPETLPPRDAMVVLTFAVFAFSGFPQGLRIGPLLRRLGLNQMKRRSGFFFAIFGVFATIPLLAISDVFAIDQRAIDSDVDQALQRFNSLDPHLERLAKESVGVLVFPHVVKGMAVAGDAQGEGALRSKGKTMAYTASVHHLLD